MRYSIRQYAEAFTRALKGKSGVRRKEVTRRFLMLVSQRRMTVKLPHILREVERQYLKERGMRKVVAEVAALHRGLRQEAIKMLGRKIVWKEKVNPELLAGIRIVVNDEVLVDASGRKQIEQMFSKTRIMN